MAVDPGVTFTPGFEVQLTPTFGYVASVEEAEEIIKQYETHTGFKFQLHQTIEAELEGISSTLCWEAPDTYASVPEACLKYDGIPYLNVRKKVFKCLCTGVGPEESHGNANMKTGDNKQTQGDGLEESAESHPGTTKKQECTAALILQEIIKYPEYKIEVDTEINRKAVSDLLKVLLEGANPPIGQRRFYVYLPKGDDHQGMHETNHETKETTTPTIESATDVTNHLEIEPSNFVVMELVADSTENAMVETCNNGDDHEQTVLSLNSDVIPSDAAAEEGSVIPVNNQQVVYACTHCPTYSTSYAEMTSHCKKVGIIPRILTPLSNSASISAQQSTAPQSTRKRGRPRKKPVNSPQVRPHLTQTAAIVGIGDDSIPIMTLVDTPVPDPPDDPEPEVVTKKPHGRPGRPRKTKQTPPPPTLEEVRKKEADEMQSHWDEENLKCKKCKMKFTRLRQLHSHRCLVDVLAKVVPDDSEEAEEEFLKSQEGDIEMADYPGKEKNGGILKLDVPEEEKVKIEQTIFQHEIPQSMNDQAPSYRGKFNQNTLKVYTCPYCKKFFKHKQGMIHHIRSHTNYKPFKCPLCDYASISKGNLKTHERKHTGERFKCSQCEFTTISKGHLRVHSKSHKKVQTRCQLCNKNVYTPTNLIRHLEASHNVKAPGKARDYYEKKKLQTREGKRALLFQCNVCNRKFKTKREHDSHHLLHTTDKPFVCSLCNYKTVRDTYLDQHLRKHRLVYLCSMCNSKHLSMQLLKEHIATHDLEEHVDRPQYEQQVYIDSINRSIYMAEIFDKELESARLNRMTGERLEPTIVDFMQGTTSSSHSAAVDGEDRSEFGGEVISKDQLKELLGINNCKWLYKRLNVATLREILKLYGEHECKPCGKLFLFKTHHDTHTKVHMDTKEFKCRHDNCEYSAHSQESMKTHLEIAHSGIRYKCAECGFETRGKAYLERHMTRRHGAQDAFKCTRCDVAFGCEKEMKKHITDDHPSMLQEEIEKIIGKRTHIYRKQGKEWFQCNRCPLKFRKMSELRQHIWMHDGLTPYKCDICGHGARLLSNLKAHMRRHSDAKTHLCDECGKSFKTKNSLKVHHLSQHLAPSQDKSDRDKCKILVKCHYCDFSCVQRSQLKKHLDIHIGNRQFKCGICIQHFTNTQGGLRSHYSKQHPDVIFDESLFLKDIVEEVEEETSVEPLQTLTQYKCTQCHTMYDSFPSLEEHFQLEHNVTIATSGEEAAASVLIQAAALAEGAVDNAQEHTVGNTGEGLQISIPAAEGINNGAAELLQQIISMQNLGQLPSGSNQVQIELPAISQTTTTDRLMENAVYDIISSTQAQSGTSLKIQNFGVVTQQDSMVTSQESMVTSHDAMVTSHDSMATSHDSMVTSHDSMATSHDSMVTSQDSMATSHDAMVTSHDAIVTSHDSLVPNQQQTVQNENTVASSIMQVQLQVTESGEQYYVTTEGNGNVEQQVVVINEAGGEQETTTYMEVLPDTQQAEEQPVPTTSEDDVTGADQQITQAIIDAVTQHEVTINTA